MFNKYVPTARIRAAALALLLAAAAAVMAFVPTGWPAGNAAAGAAGAAPAGVWSWPVRPDPEVIRSFEKPAQHWLAGHRGVDLAAPVGDAVRSPAHGTVRYAGVVVDRGVLTVDHGDGTVSSFEPVTATVSVGDPVTAGQPIGLLASRGGGTESSPRESTQPHCPGSCLHWGVRLNGEYVDPLRYVMDRRPSVLLPLAAGPDG